jgi:hypothetical protein
MIEFFVRHEEATLMRELGFNEPCMAHYNVSYSVKAPQQFLHPYPLAEQGEYLLLAPTYEQAFQWIRRLPDKLRMIALISPIDDWEFWTYKILAEDTISPFFEITPIIELQYLSYEDAQLACLSQMISILKTNSDNNETTTKQFVD